MMLCQAMIFKSLVCHLGWCYAKPYPNQLEEITQHWRRRLQNTTKSTRPPVLFHSCSKCMHVIIWHYLSNDIIVTITCYLRDHLRRVLKWQLLTSPKTVSSLSKEYCRSIVFQTINRPAICSKQSSLHLSMDFIDLRFDDLQCIAILLIITERLHTKALSQLCPGILPHEGEAEMTIDGWYHLI